MSFWECTRPNPSPGTIQIQAIYWTSNDDVMAELGLLVDYLGPATIGVGRSCIIKLRKVVFGILYLHIICIYMLFKVVRRYIYIFIGDCQNPASQGVNDLFMFMKQTLLTFTKATVIENLATRSENEL